MKDTRRVAFYLSDKLWTDLKIMGVLTHRSISDIMRISLQEKLLKLKEDQVKSN